MHSQPPSGLHRGGTSMSRPFSRRTLLLAAGGATAGALAGCSTGGNDTAGPTREYEFTEPTPTATVVNVTAGKPSELRFTLSKKSVAKGKVTFKVVNKGALDHDFKIAGKKTARLKAGKTATLTVTLKAGKDATNATIYDIDENAKKLKFVETDPAQLVRSLDDLDVAVINGNYALEANLSPSKDAILVEEAEGNPNRRVALEKLEATTKRRLAERKVHEDRF